MKSKSTVIQSFLHMSIRAILTGGFLAAFFTLVRIMMPAPQETEDRVLSLFPTLGFVGLVYVIYSLDWLAKRTANVLMHKQVDT